MKPVSAACNPPARPAVEAARTKATVRTGSGPIPMLRAAAGADAVACMARPSGPRAKVWKATSASTQKPQANNAVPPVLNGAAIPVRPLDPPVRSRHSIETDSTMKPKAIVTMAR